MKKSLALFLSFAVMMAACLALPQKIVEVNQPVTKQVVEEQPVFADNSSEVVYQAFDFENGIVGWSKYTDCKIDLVLEQGFTESNTLAFNCSFDPSTAYSWDTAPIFMSPNIPSEVGSATHLAMDIYTDSNFTTGGLNVTPIIMSPQHTYWYMLSGMNIMADSGSSVGNFKKYTLSFSLNELASTDVINYITITTAGVNTNYSGKIYYDNIRLISYGEAKPAEHLIAQVSVKNSYHLIKNEEIVLSCTAAGGTAPYYYTYYALKDGKIYYKSDLRQSNPSVSFTVSEAGEYKVIAYSMDSGSGRTLCKKEFTITVYNDASEIPEAKNLIALTFDDGPDANAGELLDVLAEKDVKATFFVLHEYAQYNTALLKRTYDEGHQIGNHTYTHAYLTQLSKEDAIAEIDKNNDFIESVIGIRTDTYRPPYLDYNTTVLNYFPTMTAIGCSIDSKDWSGISKEQIISNVTSNPQDGDIVLLHEPQANTRAAIGEIIDILREKGFEMVTVDELFARKNIEKKGAAYYSYVR